jgi:hypothetical protein
LGVFTYPTNFVSRFPTAPWVAARVQRLLSEPACDFRGELTLHQDLNPTPFRSRLGKTRGLLGPNEFWYWWRRFLPENDSHCLTVDQTAAVDLTQLRAELAAWEAVHDKPLLMKGLILNWNLDWLATAVPGCVFVHIHRDPVLNMQSLLEAREDFFGDRGQWYSFRPPEYAALTGATAAEQVAAQVRFTEAGVQRGLDAVPAHRKISVSYEELCAAPATVYGALRARLSDQGCDLPAVYGGPASFPVSNTLRLDPATEADVRAAWAAGPDLLTRLSV